MVGASASSSTCRSTTRSRPRRGRHSGVASQGILGSIHPGIVAPWHLSYYHCFAYTTPGVKAPPRRTGRRAAGLMARAPALAPGAEGLEHWRSASAAAGRRYRAGATLGGSMVLG